MDWPVERTARRAAGQMDGLLSDLNFGEVFPFVAKPLSRDAMARYIGPTLGGQIGGLSRSDPLVLDLNPIAFVAGRPYMDLSAYLNLPAIAYHLDTLEAADEAKGKAVVALVRAGRLLPIPLSFTERLRLHFAYARLGLRSLGWLIRLQTPVDLLDAYAHTTDRLREVVHRPLEGDSANALLADLDREFNNESDPTKNGLRHLGLAFFLHTTLQRLCAGRIPLEWVNDLGKGIPNNPTIAVSLDLWTLAQEACPLADVFEKTPPEILAHTLAMTDEGRRWWAGFEEFLFRHGHRGEVELDLTTPRWREDPTFLLQTVTNYLRHPAGMPAPTEVLAECVRRREAAVSAIRGRLPLPLRSLFTWLSERYVLWLPFREAAKYTWLLGLEQARRVYLELGHRLAAAGHLKAREDVFWLRLNELSVWAETGTVSWTAEAVESRARQWGEWTTIRPPSLIIGTRGIEAPAAKTARGGESVLLRGTPASSGQAEGIARVITDPHRADLRPGEILVTRYTDPAWTPLFFTAKALITEIGGVLSHGAVIAREVGLPAVVGVAEATARIKSGQRVKVDAVEGTVELL